MIQQLIVSSGAWCRLHATDLFKEHACLNDLLSSSPLNIPLKQVNQPASELISEEYFCETPNDIGEVFVDKVTNKELKALQKEIVNIVRPPYRHGPPSNLGNPGHGKLKADQ